VVDEVCLTGDDKIDGNKFALAFLAASGSILYTIYNIIQNAPIAINSYLVICLMIAGAVISIIGFLAYLLIKGYLMEAQDTEVKEELNILASVLYKCSISVFALLACLIVVLFFEFNAPSEIKELIKMICWIIIGLFIIISVIIIIYQSLTMKKQNKTSSMKKLSFEKRDLAGFILAVVVGIIWTLLFFCFVYYTPLQGHVDVDMESIHYKNDTQIPALIQVTGPNTGLYAFLYKELPDNVSNVSKISFIGPIEPIFLDLESDWEERKIESNNILLSNYQGNGKYIVFINTTNLTTGYYELMCLRIAFYEKTCERKSFYLLNRS